MPVRQCIACRRRGDKPTLVRLVVADSSVGVDTLATMPGRGAYLCGRTACTDVALRRDGALLRRALRVQGGQVTVDGARLSAACAAAARSARIQAGRTAGD